jgi:hypothetical protein
VSQRTFVLVHGAWHGLATDLPASVFGRFRDERTDLPHWKTVDIHCGHDVMIDLPDRTVEILQAA